MGCCPPAAAMAADVEEAPSLPTTTGLHLPARDLDDLLPLTGGFFNWKIETFGYEIPNSATKIDFSVATSQL